MIIVSDIWGSGCSMFQHLLRVTVVHVDKKKEYTVIKGNPKAYRTLLPC